MTEPTGPTADAPRGEAPKWVPLVGLAGLLLMFLFTTWYMNTEPPHRWKDASVDATTDGAVDASPD